MKNFIRNNPSVAFNANPSMTSYGGRLQGISELALHRQHIQATQGPAVGGGPGFGAAAIDDPVIKGIAVGAIGAAYITAESAVIGSSLRMGTTALNYSLRATGLHNSVAAARVAWSLEVGIVNYTGNMVRTALPIYSVSGATYFRYRALHSVDGANLSVGRGLFGKNPQGSWSLGQHLVSGSSARAWVHNPWIATSSNINIARSFMPKEGVIGMNINGLARIDLRLVPGNAINHGFNLLPRSHPGYHLSIWQQETSIFGYIPKEAVKLIK